MFQGDAYSLSITLQREDGTPITSADVKDVEISVGHICKTTAKGVQYLEGKWTLPLTQEESFGFPDQPVKAQARILWPSGDVQGVSLGQLLFRETISKEVLE